MTNTMWAALAVGVGIYFVVCYVWQSCIVAREIEEAEADERQRFAIPRRRPIETVRMWDEHWQSYHTVSVIFAMPLHEIEDELDHREMQRRHDERNDSR